MNKILIFINFLLILIIILCVNLYIKNFVHPNTYLSRFNLSGKSKKQVLKITDPSVFAIKTVDLKVKNRIYKIKYQDVGVFVDKAATINIIFENNNKPFPENLIAFIQSFSSQRLILPVILFTQEFYDFTQNTIFDFSQRQNDVVIDNQNKQINYGDYEEKYKIEPENFKKQIIFNFGKDASSLEPYLKKIDENALKKQVILEYNKRLSQAFDQPVDIIINNDPSQKISILITDLKKIINVNYDKEIDKVNFLIEDSPFSTLVLSKLTPYSDNDKKVDIKTLKNNLISLVNSRFNGIKSNIIVARIDVSANTSGEVNLKYIEIDLSQQNMYLFENKELTNIFKISSGLYYPTPIGKFKILNKALNAYSDIYHVWMPFWMAFYYDTKLSAYFGIHELPYWVSGEGQKIQRPRDFIGSPHTGGCISLDIGAANEVYNFAEVDMPIYIYE